MTSTQERYDLVILGSGSTAFAAALQQLRTRLQALGLGPEENET